MITFKKVLFPIDFSTQCFQTMSYVSGLSRKFGSEVTLLNVLDAADPFGYGAASRTVVYGTERSTLWHQRETAMAEFGVSDLRGLKVARVIREGDPAEAIARYAQEHGTDLVVIPTHGYGGFRRLLLGSVTTKVLNTVHCPVWTTAHCEGLDSRCAECLSQIVCGVDLSDVSARVMRVASELAEQYHARLRLVHAVDVGLRGCESTDNDTPLERFLMDTAVEKLGALQKEAHVESGAQPTVDTCVTFGRVAEVIRQAALDSGAGLAVLGRGHAGKFLGSLRTHLNAVITSSPCPVLTL